MRHPIPPQHLDEGQPQNANVKLQGLALQIDHIQLDLFRNRQLVAAIDLRPTGQAWHQGVHALLYAQSNQVLLIEQHWARAHKAHVPRQNAPQLRQLVQAALA